MPHYVLHFGHNVYLTAEGGMTRKITEARVFHDKTTARQTARTCVLPPNAARMSPPPNPPEVEEFQGNAVSLELQLELPPQICRIH